MYYDAHNHLQDERLRPHLDAVMAAVRAEPIARMVVNGSCEEDWPAVLNLARQYPEVLPSFGCHPWYIRERSPGWQGKLIEYLDQIPSAMGEIGMDRWIRGHDLAQQEEVFTWQLRLAAERDIPVSIHCLEAWGSLLSILQSGPRPRRGFLLHSYGGSPEMIPGFAKLGAYFSLPGYFAHARKGRQRETFRHVPPERLLIETDAPDQLLPDQRNRFPLLDGEGKPINHPANLRAVYEFAAELLGARPEELAARVESNFLRLFE
ncbi:MAG TPA: TatD family hydrolase [Candidatus Baltobacteraceae bacterium]|jgi:TatD DNase family protein|nr:TatD family hydrolase [Candidatus Baltobacteraceae bacterium]